MLADHDKGNWNYARAAVATAIVLAAAALRIAPYPMNFTPIGAVALFGGAYFPNKRAAVAVPLLSLLAGDIFIGFHPLLAAVYASFLINVVLGCWLCRAKRSASFSSRRFALPLRVGAATLLGASQFFLITNFAMWASAIASYPKTAGGLAECFLAGLPLFWNTLAGDAFYSILLFGAMILAEQRFPRLREPLAA